MTDTEEGSSISGAASGPPASGSKSEARHASMWWRRAFGATLACAMGAGPLAMFSLTALSPYVTAELELSRTRFGLLTTAVFVVAALGSAVSGRVIDRLGAQRTLLVLFATAAIALLAAASASTFGWLLLAVALTGLGQSLSNPVTNQLVSLHALPGRRGLLLGVKQSGVMMSQFAAGATLPALAAVLGWRRAIASTAAVVVVGAAATVALFPRDAARSHATDVGVRGGGVDQLPSSVWWLSGYAFLSGGAAQATNVYMPLYLFEELGFTAAVAGASTGVMGGVGLVARIGWGRLAEAARAPQLALTVLALGAAGGVALIAVGRAAAPAWVWVGMGLHGATALAANVVVMMTVLKAVTREQVGRASGVVSVGLYLGFAVAPVLFGYLADSHGGYGPAWIAALSSYALSLLVVRCWSAQMRRNGESPPSAAPRIDR